MKKMFLLFGIFSILCQTNASAQWWDLTGTVAGPGDYIGTNNPVDFRFYTGGGPRGRITFDGNWDFGFNTYTASTVCGAFGQANNFNASNNSFLTGGMNLIQNTNFSGAMGHNNMIDISDAVVALGQGNHIDTSNQSVCAGEDLHLVHGHGCFMAGGHSHSDGAYNVSIGRHADTKGFNLHSYGSDLYNDLNSSIAMGFSNNRTMVLTDRGVSIQVSPGSGSTVAPTHNLIVDANPVLGVNSNISFLNVPTTTKKYPHLVIEPISGEIFLTTASSGSGVSTSCFTADFVPKSDASGNLSCSQIYDDATSVGIATTGPFGYTAGSGVFIAGAPGTQTVKLDVNGLTRSVSFVATSDKKYKTNITTLDKSLDKVMKLNGVEYNWKASQYPSKQFDDLKHSGYIAQELLEVLPNAVVKDQNGDYAVDYNSIIPVLSEAIKEQQKQIEELKKLIQDKNASSTGIFDDKKTGESGSAFLAQNVPNPFSAATEIKYQLPKGTQKATIGIHDMNGKEIKLIQLSTATSGSITIQGGDLQPGMYWYTLVIDGKYFDGKKMVLTSQ